MAKVFGAVLGKNRGKIGQVNFWVVKGTQFNRAMPTVAKRRGTSAQLDQRQRFRTLGKLATAFMAASKIGLKDLMDKAYENAISVFVQLNQRAVTVESGEEAVDYADLLCAKGSMPEVAFGNASFSTAQTVSVTFSTDADMPGTDAQDKVYMFVYQPDSNTGILSTSVLRTTGTISLHVPAAWVGMTVHAYGFAVGAGSLNEGKISNSTYIGTGSIA